MTVPYSSAGKLTLKSCPTFWGHSLGVDARLVRLLVIWPLAFTTLWLLHIAVYGIRVVTWMRRASDPHDQVMDRPEDGNRGTSSWGYPESSPVTRRRMLHAFLRNAGWAVLASLAVPIISGCNPGPPTGCDACRSQGQLCCMLPPLFLGIPTTSCCPSSSPIWCIGSFSCVASSMACVIGGTFGRTVACS